MTQGWRRCRCWELGSLSGLFGYDGVVLGSGCPLLGFLVCLHALSKRGSPAVGQPTHQVEIISCLDSPSLAPPQSIVALSFVQSLSDATRKKKFLASPICWSPQQYKDEQPLFAGFGGRHDRKGDSSSSPTSLTSQQQQEETLADRSLWIMDLPGMRWIT